ncbi:MAG: Heterodisulfide reductase subunit A-like protein [Methanomethylovorans sp. PtaU1.Bin073]|jgi:MinD superfamily P-loop ATPase|nr:MAG: Heterodisulfide reductase subunit A-like protein [Methanomethylovorans sp. PtaU1.Bin073]
MVKQMTVISGKGGTGKTTLTAAFASLATNALMADCDVDAADLHLILKPESTSKLDFNGMEVASINKEKCSACGICRERCRFDAISKELTIDEHTCEGCGVCTLICPEDAIIMKEHKAGEIYRSITRVGPLAHARLGIGEETGGKLVSMVRKSAIEMASMRDIDLIIIDGPPGIGCSVIASISGVDLVFIVTEPSISGMHDLDRVLEVTTHFEIKTVVCINKYDINEQKTALIEEYCRNKGVEVIGKLPLSDIPMKAMLKRKTVIEYEDNSFARTVIDMWHKIASCDSLKLKY